MSPRPSSTRAALVVLALGLALFLLGCGEEREPLRSWTLQAPGVSGTLLLPARIDGRLPARPLVYVLTTRATVPSAWRGQALTLAIPNLAARASLHVDGQEATLLDPPTFASYHVTDPLRWRVPAAATADGMVELELRVEHRWRQSGWLSTVPFLTPEPDGGRTLVLVASMNRAAAGAALAASCLVLLLYGYLFVSLRGRPRRNVYGLFALAGVAGIFYPAFVLGVTQPLFGIYESPIVGCMLIVGSVAAIYFSHAYFGEPPPHPGWKGWVSFAAVAAALASDPFKSIQLLAPLIGISLSANTVMQIVLLFRLSRRNPRPNNLYLIVLAWPATTLLAAPDVFASLGLGEALGGARTACLSGTVIAIAQATALLREHIISLTRADALNAELGERVELLESKQREVALLNDELRRQIAARTKQLAASLVHGESDDTAPPVVKLEDGAVVDDRYQVVRTIGKGGMGAVYEVVRLADGKPFALKTLSVSSDPESRARFAREAQLAANVKHPNVVALVDFDEARLGYLFLVMEFVSGNTLHEVRRRQRDVPWTLFVLAQVAEGLDAIHAAGIVHRDLKPTNVLLSRGSDGRRPLVKITDFGVSSLLSDEGSASMNAAVHELDDELPPISHDGARDSHDLSRPAADLTQTGVVFGTPNYMAAELTEGTKAATQAADVYALAVIAFELLTFRRPFDECPVRARQAGRPLTPPPDFARACPTLPRVLAALLTRALGHEPARRPTAREVAVALRLALASLSEVVAVPPSTR